MLINSRQITKQHEEGGKHHRSSRSAEVHEDHQSLENTATLERRPAAGDVHAQRAT